MRRLLPPHLFVLTALLMFLTSQSWPHSAWPWPARAVGLALLLVGLISAAWHARLFRRVGTPVPTFEQPQVLVQAGLFNHSRNPMYLGFALALFGLCLLLDCWVNLIWLLAFVLVVQHWYIAFEERAMRSQFGDAYAAYCARVRRWL